MARLSLKLLDEALVDNDARFAASRIIAVANTQTHATRKLRQKLKEVFLYTPQVRIEGRSIIHEASGMTFSTVEVNRTPYLIGCGHTARSTIRCDVPLTITSGMCLFGSSSLIGRSDSSVSLAEPHKLAKLTTKLSKIIVDERLHVYEVETIVRLTSFFMDLADALNRPVTVAFHLPATEYELYGLYLYSRGLVDVDTLQAYRSAIRIRANLLKGMLSDQLDGSLIRIDFVSNMGWLEGLNLSRTAPSAILASAVGLAEQQNNLWRDILKAKPVHSLLDINYASYMYTYFDQHDRARRLGLQHILVENPDESPIYRNAVLLQDELGRSLEDLCGLYIHPKVVVTQTFSGDADNVLYTCRNGTNKDTIALALESLSSLRKQHTLSLESTLYV